MTNVGEQPTTSIQLRKQTYSNKYDEKPGQKYHLAKYILESQIDMKYEMIYERIPSRINNEFGNLRVIFVPGLKILIRERVNKQQNFFLRWKAHISVTAWSTAPFSLSKKYRIFFSYLSWTWITIQYPLTDAVWWNTLNTVQ